MEKPEDSFELVALNEDGEERAFIRFDGQPWKVTDLAEIISGWAETNPNRTVVLGKHMPLSPEFRNRKGA